MSDLLKTHPGGQWELLEKSKNLRNLLREYTFLAENAKDPSEKNKYEGLADSVKMSLKHYEDTHAKRHKSKEDRQKEIEEARKKFTTSGKTPTKIVDQTKAPAPPSTRQPTFDREAKVVLGNPYNTTVVVPYVDAKTGEEKKMSMKVTRQDKHQYVAERQPDGKMKWVYDKKIGYTGKDLNAAAPPGLKWDEKSNRYVPKFFAKDPKTGRYVSPSPERQKQLDIEQEARDTTTAIDPIAGAPRTPDEAKRKKEKRDYLQSRRDRLQRDMQTPTPAAPTTDEVIDLDTKRQEAKPEAVDVEVPKQQIKKSLIKTHPGGQWELLEKSHNNK